MRKRLRFRDLVERGVVRNRPTLQNWIRDRGFPSGQLTGPNSRTWGEDEVEDWLARRPTGPKRTPDPSRRPGRPRKPTRTGAEA
jgi:predicted DNA-binding transcriptional regulator AlpA